MTLVFVVKTPCDCSWHKEEGDANAKCNAQRVTEASLYQKAKVITELGRIETGYVHK